MVLQQKIQQDLKEAAKNKDALVVSVLRMLSAALVNKEIEKRPKGGGPLNDDEILAVLSSEIKKRKDAMGHYEKGKREDLFEKEKKELDILMNYMPKQMDRDEIKKEAESVIREIGARSPQDQGRVMGSLMPRLKGKAEGKIVGEIVGEILNVMEHITHNT